MRYALFTLVLAVGCVAAAQADVMTTQAGDGADATIRFGTFGNDTFGAGSTANDLEVRTHPAPNLDAATQRFVRWTYLRFDISGATTMPNPGVANDLVLTLTHNGEFSPSGNDTYPNATFPVIFGVYGLIDGTAGDLAGGWNETTVTGNNAPGAATYESLTTDVTSMLASTVVPAIRQSGGKLSFSSSALTDFLLADTNDLLTLILIAEIPTTGGSNAHASFHSKEGASLASGNQPTLTIVPEPASMALMGLGTMLALARRQRTATSQNPRN